MWAEYGKQEIYLEWPKHHCNVLCFVKALEPSFRVRNLILNLAILYLTKLVHAKFSFLLMMRSISLFKKNLINIYKRELALLAQSCILQV